MPSVRSKARSVFSMEAAKHDKRTVFVRGISFSTGPDDFEAHFSELGPVRTSFLVKDKGQSGHKGFGFVQYALPEDAQKATEQFHNTEFQGRKLKVEPAVKRAPLNDRNKRKLGEVDSSVQPEAVAAAANANDSGLQPKPEVALPASNAPSAAQSKPTAAKAPPKVSARASKKARKQREGTKPAANPKQRLVRTVALGNWQSGSTEEALAMAHAAGKVESVEDPPSDLDISHARLKQDGCTGLVIFVVYDSVKAALAAVAKLHGQPLGKQTQKSAKRQKVGATEDVSEQLWARQVSGEGLHLKKWRLIIRNLAFQAKASDLKGALEAGGGFVWELSLPRNAEGSLKGFGFATFMTRGHAESAIKNTNGKVVAGRQVVVDWAMAKARFMDASAQPPDKQGGPDAAQLADIVRVDGDASELQGPAVLGQQEQDTAEVVDPAAEQKMVQNVLDALLQDEEPVKPQGGPAVPPAAKAGADAAQKQSAAAQAGQVEGTSKAEPSKLAQARPEADCGAQQAGARDSSKTVFVRALPADASQDQLHLAFSKFGKLRSCRLVMNKETQQPKGTAFVEYWDTSAAKAAAAACQKAREGAAGGVMVGGRTVEVDLALSQDDARSLASGGRASSGPGKDNRNLYLAKEGTIEEGSAAWDSMSATDRSKRKRAAEEKNTKLRSPNFSVSRTRLSVRNIPFTLQEKELKQLFIAAVKEHASKAQPRVKQAKILRDPERIDPADGLPRSRGLGFVEFSEHEHAICALRHLNNNPAPFSRDKRPIVEFALESAQAVRKMATKQAWQKTQTQGKAGAGQQWASAAAAGVQPAQQTALPASKPSKERQPTKKRPVPQDAAVQSKNKRAKGKAEPAVAQVKPAPLQQRPVKGAGSPAKRSVKQDGGPSKQSVERKRHADAALDQLAARAAPSRSGAQQRGKLKKGGQAKGEKRDKLDDMISSYKSKYFEAQMQTAPATQHSKTPAAGISRWFE